VPPTAPAELDSGRGWLVAGAATMSTFAVFGVAYSFGAFFNAMSEEFDVGSGQTALFFSITISLSFFLGLFTGRWADRVGPRPVLIVAAISLATGLLTTAAVNSIWLGYLTYGVGVGFAVACGYVPMVAAVSGWFERRRAAALGVAVAGIGLGTLVGSPLAARLIDATSWRTTYVIFAIGGASLLLLASTVAERGPAAPPAERARPLGELIRIRDFAILYLSSVFASFGLFVPFVFLADYAEERGISSVRAAVLVGLIGGASIVGRLGLGGLADRVDVIRLYIGSFLVMMISHFVWLGAADRYWQLVVYTVILGVGYGGFIALSPAVAANRFGVTGLGGVLGTIYTAAGIGSLGGPPVAGLLIDEFGYRTAIGFAAAMTVVSAAVLLPLAQP
jgi:MFS family permease